MEQLHQIGEGLSIELSNETNGIRELVISAEGDMDKFPLVKEVVAKAPAIVGWKIIAFRQPAAEDFTLEYENVQLTPSELYFVPVVENNFLDILIFGKGFKNYDFETLAHYGLIMLDNVMGEYNSVMKVRHYDFVDLEEVADPSQLRPLPEINAFLEDFYQNRN